MHYPIAAAFYAVALIVSLICGRNASELLAIYISSDGYISAKSFPVDYTILVSPDA